MRENFADKAEQCSYLAVYLRAEGTFGREVLFVARHAVAFLFFGNETLRSNRLGTGEAREAVLVKLLSPILEFLRA